MIRQLVDMLPAGPINVDDRRHRRSRSSIPIESLINHFKLIMEGPQVPLEIVLRKRGAKR